MNVSLPKNIQTDKIVLQFCLEDSEARFGQSFIAVIFLHQRSSLDSQENSDKEQVLQAQRALFEDPITV